jgi:hypothetical protein
VELAAVGLDETPVGVFVAPASRLEQLLLSRSRACGSGTHGLHSVDR